MRRILAYLTIAVLCLFACSPLKRFPRETYYQFNHSSNYKVVNDTLIFQLENPLLCPLRVSITTSNPNLSHIAQQFGTVTLKEKSDTTLYFYLPNQDNPSFKFTTAFGDLNKPISKNPIALPFPKSKSYMILQGYNGSFSHNAADYSRYALDFYLKSNDTICSVDYGFVVGVIKDYKYGGSTTEWKNNDKSNYITIYHPNSGLFTQYVHLIHQGSFVTVGDTVNRGTPIGLSGSTGYTSIEHLHFNVLQPDASKKLISTEIEFESGYKGSELTKGAFIKNE